MAHPSDTDSDALSNTNDTDTDNPSPQRRKGLGGLSVTQVVGGALASMSAAALGSGLGVAGTVVGAALVSVSVAILGSLYTASIKHTQRGVQKLVQTVGPAAATARSTPSSRRRDTSGSARDDADGNGSVGSEPPGRHDRGKNGSPHAPSKRRRIITGALAGAGAVFVITLGGILTIELISGHSFQGKPGGTTIGQAVRGKDLTHSDRRNPPGDSDRPGGQQSGNQSDRNNKPGQNNQDQPDQNNNDKPGHNDQDKPGQNNEPGQNDKPDQNDKPGQNNQDQPDQNNNRPKQHNDQQPGSGNDKNPDSGSGG